MLYDFYYFQDMVSTGEMVLVPHAKFSFILLLVLFIAIFLVILFKFQLSRKLAVSFVIMYCLFVAYAYIQDLYCNYECWDLYPARIAL
jgi:Ca2+/Na+ antiporter